MFGEKRRALDAAIASKKLRESRRHNEIIEDIAEKEYQELLAENQRIKTLEHKAIEEIKSLEKEIEKLKSRENFFIDAFNDSGVKAKFNGDGKEILFSLEFPISSFDSGNSYQSIFMQKVGLSKLLKQALRQLESNRPTIDEYGRPIIKYDEQKVNYYFSIK